jgi:Gas vesicle synthesis protein GvpL/GvpF
MPLCVYAIIGRRRSHQAFTRAKFPRLRLVTAGAVSAVVADCDGKPPLSAGALRGHDAVVRRVARVVRAILPARFGTILDSESSVVVLLERSAKDLREALALVEGREQMTLRLFAGDGGSGTTDRSGGKGMGGGKGGEKGDAPSGTRYLLRRAREQATPAAPELERLREVLKAIVTAERVVRHDRGPLILTAYHLIPRGGAPAYRRLLRRHATQLHNRVVASGPWPPYGFAPELRR